MTASWVPQLVLCSVLLLRTMLSLYAEEDAYYYVITDHSASSSCPIGKACLTLTEYAQLTGQNTSANTTLFFLPGNHTLQANVSVENATAFHMIANTTYGKAESIITCSGTFVVLSFQNISLLEISGIGFSSCGASNGVIYLTAINNFEVASSVFQENMNTPLVVMNSHGIVRDCSFIENQAEDGGGVFATSSWLYFLGSNSFEHNYASSNGGGISARSSYIQLEDVTFRRNMVRCSGGGINLYNSILVIHGNSTFDRNEVQYSLSCTELSSSSPEGGGISAQYSQIEVRGNTIFSANSISNNVSVFTNIGGGLFAKYSSLSFEGNTTFANNTEGGAWIQLSSANFNGSTMFIDNLAKFTSGGITVDARATVTFNGTAIFKNNIAGVGGGAIDVNFESTITFHGTVVLQNNTAVIGGAIRAASSTVSFNGQNMFLHNTASIGSAISGVAAHIGLSGNSTVLDNLISNVTRPDTLSGTDFDTPTGSGTINVASGTLAIDGYSNIANNVAESGGGLYLLGTNATLGGTNIFHENVAKSQSGGGIFIISGKLNINGVSIFSSNSATTDGGGIQAVTTTLFLTGRVNMTNNYASRGGGISLDYLSLLDLTGPLDVYFRNNSANLGGAIYVGDTISSIICAEYAGIPTGNLHLVQPECFFSVHIGSLVHMIFEDNFAKQSGSSLYGGLLDRCRYEGDQFVPLGSSITGSPSDIFQLISQFNNATANQTVSSEPLRVCICQAGKHDCNYVPDVVTIRRGQIFTVSAAAIDQLGAPIPAAIRAQFSAQSGGGANLEESEALQQTTAGCTDLNYRIFSSHDSEDLILYADGPCGSTGTAPRSIHANFLPCPDGFQLSNSQCICGEKLLRFTTSCNIDDETVEKHGDYWLQLLYENGSYEGLIVHPHCPFDYCVTQTIQIELNNTDVQCQFDRTGVLCGSCSSNLTLALGSSQCLGCSNIYLLLIIAFMGAGIGLVFLLLLFKLTVSRGTINGLIFYANILQVNRSIFLPFQETNILTVFISWVNLDLGIVTCFYDGMDTYAKVWLQYAFPVYLWVLIGMIILLSRFSIKMARILGTNPISILATLFLLSYAKILRTIIAALSFTFLEYPDNSTVSVWLYDGNITYLQGKHIPLFVVSLMALLFLFLPYTLLLLTGRWLLALSNLKLFKWVNSPRVSIFLDAYYGPFNPKHCYWTGLLLLIRVGLFLVFAVNALGSPSINLLAITSATLGSLAIFITPIYKSWYLNILEASMILNLGVLAAATYYVRDAGGNQAAVTYTSIGIALFSVVLLHAYLQLKETKICHWLSFHKTLEVTTLHGEDLNRIVEEVQQHRERQSALQNFVELREPLLTDQ